MTGTIPNSISNLTALEYLHLLSNSLGGTLPSGIGSLTRLTYVWWCVDASVAVDVARAMATSGIWSCGIAASLIRCRRALEV
jgi:hypothetical protein